MCSPQPCPTLLRLRLCWLAAAAARGRHGSPCPVQVPKEKVFVENKATNTGENIANSRALLAANGITPASLIVVQKPFMERRSYATFMKQWPEPR